MRMLYRITFELDDTGTFYTAYGSRVEEVALRVKEDMSIPKARRLNVIHAEEVAEVPKVKRSDLEEVERWVWSR